MNTLEGFSNWVIRSRVGLVIGFSLLFCWALWEITDLKASFSPQDLHTTFEEQIRVSEEFSEVFGKTENVLLVLIQAEDVLASEVMAFIHDVSQFSEAQLSPIRQNLPPEERGFVRVASITATDLPHATGPESFSLHSAVDEETFRASDRERILEAIEQTPLIQGQLISADHTLAAVAVFLPESINQVEDVRPVLDNFNDFLSSHPAPDGVHVMLGGLPHIRVWVGQQFKSDQILLVPLSLLVCLSILWISFRWLPGLLFPGLAVIVSAAFLLGGMAAADESINIINQVVPLLVIVIGISDSIHLVSRFREEIALGQDASDASKISCQRMAAACFLTSLTTSVGFGSLVISRTELLRRFGITAAIGVLIAYLVTIHLLPALLSWTRPHGRLKVKTTSKGQPDGFLENLLSTTIQRIIRHPLIVLSLGSLLFVCAIYGATLVNVDTRLMEIFNPGDEPFITTNLLEDELDGVLPLEVSFSGESDRFRDPEILNRIHDLKEWALTQDGVLSATAATDYLHQMRVIYHNNQALRQEQFSSAAEVYNYADLLSQATPNPMEPYVNYGWSRARLNIKVRDIGSQRIRILSDAIEEKLDEILSGIEGVDVVLTGNAYVASAGISSLVHDMFFSLLSAFIIIFALLTFLFKSFRLGVLSIPPNIMPLVFTLAYMAWAGIDLNTTTVVTFAISLGLAVDHTIHMLVRFKEALNRGYSKNEAIIDAGRGSGRAILVTTITLIAGMAVLLLSSFVPIHQFAVLLAVTAAACLLGNLVLLPALLTLFWHRDPKPSH
jgi:hypothetical protein